MDSAAWYPRFDLISLLVYAANSSSVDTVLVDGKILMEHRHLLTLDEEKICYETNKRAMALTK
jgi:5-methylthioadenosine/S-adenosylhomocysteine deaminase